MQVNTNVIVVSEKMCCHLVGLLINRNMFRIKNGCTRNQVQSTVFSDAVVSNKVHHICTWPRF